MSNSFLIFEHSAWWMPPAILFALGAAVLLYIAGNAPWSRRVSLVLGTLRFLSILGILILILNPLINQIQRQTEHPKVVLAIDNSSSMLHNEDSLTLNNLVSAIEDEVKQTGFELATYTLDGPGRQGEKVAFQNGSTDLSGQLKTIQKNMEGRNAGAVILLSDGIYNRGTSPVYQQLVNPIFTIGLGDTVPPTDINVFEVNTNQVVYQGNKFPIKVLVTSKGFSGHETSVILRRNGRIVGQQSIALSNNLQIDLEATAESPGLFRYSVEIPREEQEESADNNRLDFYVDVVEGRERILVVSRAPHPDIRAIRSAIDKSENYETFVHIPGIAPLDASLKYDVVIVHKAFSRNLQLPPIEGEPSFWYILGNDSDLTQAFEGAGVKVEVSNNQRDNVRPAYNDSFSKFEMGSDHLDRLIDYPTIEVAFGSYTVAGPVETLFHQKVGSVVTSKPLFSFFDDGSTRSATLFGTGIWKWALQEGALYDTPENFNQIVLKTIQYLSVRNDKRRFIFEPSQRTFITGKPIRFTSESYNDIYERVGGNPINLTITNEEGESTTFEFQGDAKRNFVQAEALPTGIYKYVASTNLSGRTSQVQGEFLVNKIQLENLSLTANHGLLRELSKQSGGKFYQAEEVESLNEDLEALELKGIIHTSRNFLPVINMTLILALLIVMLSTEWATRKYLGSY